MNIIKKKIGAYPIGVWIAIITLIFLSLTWVFQIYSIFEKEYSVEPNNQEESYSTVDTEKGDSFKYNQISYAIANAIWPLPIAIIAIIGILRKKLIGFIAAMMEYAICINLYLSFVFVYFLMYPISAFALIFQWIIPSLLGILGLWMNRDCFE